MTQILYHLITIVVLVLSSSHLWAKTQSLDEEWEELLSIDYKTNDIKGNTIDIGALLRDGKKVVIDFSATWCEPCWKLHQRGIGEDLWHTYGPEGSDDIYFIWVESSGASKGAIMGMPGEDSLGDWTKGGKLPYPIVSDSYMADALGIVLRSFPTVVMLSAHGMYRDVYDLFNLSADLIAMEAEQCLGEDDVPYVRSLYTPKWEVSSYCPTEILAYVGSVTPVTDYEWRVNGVSYQHTKEPRLLLEWHTPGDIEVSLIAHNTNGASEPLEQTIRVTPLVETINTFSYIHSFDNRQNAGWIRLDNDLNFQNWELLSDELSRLQAPYSVTASSFAQDGDDCLVSWSRYPRSLPSYKEWISYSYRTTSDNWLISPAIELPEGEHVKSNVTFYAKSFSAEAKCPDTLSLYVSEGANPLDLSLYASTSIIRMPIKYSWQELSCDLTPFQGKKIYLAWVHDSQGATALLLDNIKIETSGDNAIESLKEYSYCTIRFTPVGLEISTTTPLQYCFYSMDGQFIDGNSILEGAYMLSRYDQLDPGLYILKCWGAMGEKSFKIIKR